MEQTTRMASFDSVLFVLRPFSLPWNAVRFQFQLRHGCMCRARVIKRLDALHSFIKIRQIATNSSGERFLGFSKALSFFFSIQVTYIASGRSLLSTGKLRSYIFTVRHVIFAENMHASIRVLYPNLADYYRLLRRHTGCSIRY